MNCSKLCTCCRVSTFSFFTEKVYHKENNEKNGLTILRMSYKENLRNNVINPYKDII